MASTDSSPLSAACVRGLSDKMYDKRKASAMEVEKLIRESVATNNTQKIKRVIDLLEEYALTLNPNMKKGGLIGLAAAAAGLGTQHCQHYVSDIMKPILSCLSDTNANVRYYAAESLYNVVRVARHHIFPVFNDLFNAVTGLITDPDTNVKIGADMLDTTMKGIVKECGSTLDLATLIPVIRPKLYTTNSTLQNLLVSWLVVLHGLPSLQLVPVLTEILDGLLQMLASPHPEVVKATDSLLVSLLQCCRDHSGSVNCLALTPQLVQHAQSHNTTLKNMSLCWINELLTLGGRSLLPHAAPILAAALPCMTATNRSCKVAEEVSKKIMGMLEPTDDDVTSNAASADDVSCEQRKSDAGSVNLSSIVAVLLKHLRGDSEHCKFIALHWLHHLLKHFPNKMRGELECLCRDMLPVLSDPSDDVVVLVLMLLATIAGAAADNSAGATGRTTAAGDTTTARGKEGDGGYFRRVLRLLLDTLRANRALLDDRGPLILRELCVLLSPTAVYVCLSELLQEQPSDPEFVSSMARTMATILITSRELFALRVELRSLQTEESRSVFVSLFRCWSHNPVSVLLLCLLSQSYHQSAQLVRHLGESEVTVDFLVEVDKLVQLLECPIFTYLRLDLLNTDSKSNALVETLYGLLMILPQSTSYNTLSTRLNNLPPPHRQTPAPQHPPDAVSACPDIDFDALLEHFKTVQRNKREHSHAAVIRALQDGSNIDTLMANARIDVSRRQANGD